MQHSYVAEACNSLRAALRALHGPGRRGFEMPCVVLFIGLINRCTEAVVKFTDAPEIFVVLFIGETFIGETPVFNRFNRKKTSVNQV
jgi:hypothetical protein